ncbi:MAG: hypothetical protein KDF49_10340 [Nitrosomonas sp.]|nr:hypothetical protein [Nitrosomonas sp.]
MLTNLPSTWCWQTEAFKEYPDHLTARNSVKKFGNKAFDIVLSIDVLSHVEHPWILALDIAATVRVGGLLYARELSSEGFQESQPDYWRFTNEALRIVYHQASGLVYEDGGFAGQLALIPDNAAKSNPQLTYDNIFQFALAIFKKRNHGSNLPVRWSQQDS